MLFKAVVTQPSFPFILHAGSDVLQGKKGQQLDRRFANMQGPMYAPCCARKADRLQSTIAAPRQAKKAQCVCPNAS